MQKPKNSLKIPTLPHFFLAQTISLICYSSVLLNFHFWPENLSFVPSQCQALNQSQSSNENWKKKLLSQSEIRKIPKTQSLLKLILVYSVSIPSPKATALVAQWIARSTLRRGVRGSTPRGARAMCTILFFPSFCSSVFC